MSTAAITPRAASLPQNLRAEGAAPQLHRVAQRTHSVWELIYQGTIGNGVRVINMVTRGAIGSTVCKVFFFPLHWSLLMRVVSVQARLRAEALYTQNFWDPSKPLDSNLVDQAEIREKFEYQDHTMAFSLPDGRQVNVTYRLMQTKGMEAAYRGEAYHFVQIPGIYTTHSNNIAGIYSYLSEYLRLHRGDTLPPARFIVLTANDIKPGPPASLDDAGVVLGEVLKILNREYGKIDQLVTHSLGVVSGVKALLRLETREMLPSHIRFGQGPTSTREVSKTYWGGRLIYFFLAKPTGWTADTEQEVVDFCEKWGEDAPHVSISGVVEDYHFSGKASLCLGEKIKRLPNVNRLLFNPPDQVFHTRAHHNLMTQQLSSSYLVEGSLANYPNLAAETIGRSAHRPRVATVCLKNI